MCMSDVLPPSVGFERTLTTLGRQLYYSQGVYSQDWDGRGQRCVCPAWLVKSSCIARYVSFPDEVYMYVYVCVFVQPRAGMYSQRKDPKVKMLFPFLRTLMEVYSTFSEQSLYIRP
jgi:hypothetical protein